MACLVVSRLCVIFYSALLYVWIAYFVTLKLLLHRIECADILLRVEYCYMLYAVRVHD